MPNSTTAPRLAGFGLPVDLVARVRLTFLLFNAATTLALLPLILTGSLAGPAGDALCAVGVVVLAWKWAVELRGRSLGVAWAVIEALFILGAGAAVGSPLVVLVLLCARVGWQALDGGARELLLVTTASAAAFAGAAALSPHGGALQILEYFFLASGFPLCASLMHVVSRSLSQLARARVRERSLRLAASALTAAADRQGICRAATAAACRLVGTSGLVEARVATMSPQGLRLVACNGADVDPATPMLSRALESPHWRDHLLSGTLLQLDGDEAQALCPALQTANTTLAIPLLVNGELEGLLIVSGSAAGLADAQPGLITLAEQATLALDAAILSDELHRRRSAERFNSLIRHIADLVLIVDTDGLIRYASPSITDVLGCASEAISGTAVLDIVHPDDRRRVAAIAVPWTDTLETTTTAEFRVADGRGGWKTVEAVASDLPENVELTGIVLTIRDITERRRAEAALRESEETFRLLFEGNPQPMWVYDRTTLEFLAVNDAAIAHYGYSREEFAAMRITDIRPEEDVAPLLAHLSAGPDDDSAGPMTWRHRCKDGRIIDVQITWRQQRFVGHHAVLVLAKDVTEWKAMERQLRHQAFHDPLTGLANRALLADRTEQALARARRRHRYRPVMLVVDLDGFKAVNDTLGHAAGDELLASVADRLRSCLRPSDTAARLGGDEFALLIDEVEDVVDAVRVAQRVADVLRPAFFHSGREVSVTCSIGIAPARLDHRGMDDVLRDADIAMYVAKGRGRGCHAVFEPAFHAAMIDRIRLHDELRAAIGRGELSVVYQPQVVLPDRRVTTVEALVRWQHPVRGEVLPGEFIPVAEESGLITTLDAWVVTEATRQLARWSEHGVDDLRVAVNLSGRDFDGGELADHVGTALAVSGIEPWRLEIELTEGATVRQHPEALKRLHALRAKGIRIAIDDFGTGYSMLSRLRDLPVDRLKIDRTFVRDLCVDDDSIAIVRAAIEMGHSLGLSLVAEGVESEAALDELVRLGCDAAQGYHIGEPMQPDELLHWLRESQQERAIAVRSAPQPASQRAAAPASADL